MTRSPIELSWTVKKTQKHKYKKTHRRDNADDGVESGDLAKDCRKQILLSQLSQQTEIKKFVKVNVLVLSNIESELSTC